LEGEDEIGKGLVVEDGREVVKKMGGSVDTWKGSKPK
jgi:hypothetical protein